MTHTDDEDWLYRRGRYDGVPGGAEPPQPSAAPVPKPPEPTRYGTPTPVGHYRLRSAEGPADPPPPPPPPPAPRRPPAAAQRRPPVRRIVAWALVGLLVYLLGIPLLTWPFMPRTPATPEGDRPADTPGQVFVLAGSDSREGLSPEEQERLGTGSDAGRRTDTIMLLYVPPTGRAALVSVPRDSFVPIPGHGRNKINAAFAIGGAPLLVETLEQNTGLRVDGFAEIGFGGFAGVVDAVGGIEMCPETAIKDRDSNLDIPAGCQQMDGATALGYVRMRKADPKGDLGRAERQREMVTALAKKALSPQTILIPWRWWGVNWTLSRGITIGEEDGPAELFGLGMAAARIGTGSADMLVVPIGNASANTSAGSSVLWDANKSTALFEAMARGEGDLTAYA